MAMLWQLSLHQRVSVTKLKVGYKNVDDDSFLKSQDTATKISDALHQFIYSLYIIYQI